MNNKLIPIRLCAIEHDQETTLHPQKYMAEIAKKIGAEVIYAEPVAIADCWFFILRLDIPDSCYVMDSKILEHYKKEIENAS